MKLRGGGIAATVAEVAARFSYKEDPRWPVDPWHVMRDSRWQMQGDCDDFVVTCLYRYFGFWGFIWNVCITHKARVFRVRTFQGENHVVASFNGLWFDNWTGEAVPKAKFFQRTRHSIDRQYYSLVFIPKLIAGLVYRYTV